MRFNQMHSQESLFKDKAREKRRKLTHDEFEHIAGKQDILLRKTQKKYKIAKREAEKQIKEWEIARD
ncbi:MAG: CsbD family protein [Methylomicrobium sp.]